MACSVDLFLANPGFWQLVNRHMGGISSGWLQRMVPLGIVNIVFRAIKTVYNHTKGKEIIKEKNIRRGMEYRKKKEG